MLKVFHADELELFESTERRVSYTEEMKDEREFCASLQASC